MYESPIFPRQSTSYKIKNKDKVSYGRQKKTFWCQPFLTGKLYKDYASGFP